MRWRIIACFALQAVSMGAIQTRLPDVQLAIGMNDAELGLVLMGLPLGALSVFLFASSIIERFGTRRTILCSLPVQSISAALVTLAPNAVSIFVLFALAGVGNAVNNIAINVEADRVEAATGRRVMNTCHGAWSLSFLVVALLGSPIRGLGIPPVPHIWVVAPLVILALAVTTTGMSEAAARAHAGEGKRPRLAWPTLATLGLIGFGLGGDLLEGAARSWSIIFLRDSFEIAAWLESLALPAVLATMTVGRLMADRYIDRYGTIRVARAMTATAFVGLACVVFAPNAVIALAGFVLVGLGIGIIYPLMLSGAAQVGDRPAAENVAAMTLVVQIIGLAAPLLVGAVAEGFGIRFAFGIMLPLLALGYVMAGRLKG
jgi:MFS family permease